MNPGDFVVDEDARRAEVYPLAGWTLESEAANVILPLVMDEDLVPEEILERMERTKVELARYGKLGVPGEGLGWDDVEARQVRRYHARLGEILKEEGRGAGTED